MPPAPGARRSGSGASSRPVGRQRSRMVGCPVRHPLRLFAGAPSRRAIAMTVAHDPQTLRPTGVTITDTNASGLRLQAGFSATTTSRRSTTPPSRSSPRWACACTQPVAVELLREAGGEVDRRDLVRLPPASFERARSSAPASCRLRPDWRAGDEAGGRRSYFGTGSDLMNLYDLETGERVSPASRT